MHKKENMKKSKISTKKSTKKSSKNKQSSLLRWLKRQSPGSRKAYSLIVVVVMTGIVGLLTLKFTKAAYAYSTIYKPNKDANATLLACRDSVNASKPILRMKYIGKDAPFINLRTSFGPNKLGTYTQKLRKYSNNWVWEGSYPIPQQATNVKIALTYDDNSIDSSQVLLSNIVKCTASTPAAPIINLTSPADGSTVSGLISVSAQAIDATGISSVQFKVDGSNFGVADTASPYSVDLNTATLTNGPHTLTANAMNAAGLSSVTTGLTIHVNNITTDVPTPVSSVLPVTPNTAWDWILTGTPTTANLDKSTRTKKLIDIDLEDNTATTISALKSKNIAVICYFSAGSSEDWRADYSKFPASVKGNALDGWAGEKWLDIRNGTVFEIMKSRMDSAVSKGCNGIEPDNVDGYANNSGFPLTANDQITYLTNLAKEAHARNLSIALKNNVDQVQQLASKFDFAINEECYQYKECGVYSAFLNANKAVLNAEYKSLNCASANSSNIDSVLFALDLNNSKYQSCR